MSEPVRVCTVAERRARLALRQALVPGHRARSVGDVARSVVCLHATDPATVYLSAWSRMGGMTVKELDDALYVDRTLVKHMAMRRTIFAFPEDRLDVAQSAASQRVADRERDRLARDVEGAGLRPDGRRWLADAERAVVAALADGAQLTSSELRVKIPMLEGSIEFGAGKSWGGRVPVGPRVLTCLSAAGLIVRAGNDGHWATSRPRWASIRAWIGRDLTPPDVRTATAQMVSWWLQAFGPGTEGDLKWWLGSTLGLVRRALSDLAAVPVDLGGQQVGYLLPDDVEPVAYDEPWGALLPGLDPTTMGWAGPGREFYLGGHRAALFDSNGNAGPTAWWCGRIVGGWRQDFEGAVEVQLLEDVGRAGRDALDRIAAELSEWLAGRRVMVRFPSPLFGGG